MTSRPKRERTENTRLYALVDWPQRGIKDCVFNQAASESSEETAAAALELLHRGPALASTSCQQAPQSADGEQICLPTYHNTTIASASFNLKFVFYAYT